MEGEVLCQVRLLLQRVQEGHQGHQAALATHHLHAGHPVSGLVGADALLLHIEEDVLFVPDLLGVLHEVEEDGVLA